MPPTKKNGHDHKQVPITDCNGDTIFEVDQGIQSLIQYLYDKGIRTFNSCEDNAGGNVWVEYSLEAWMGICSIVFHKQSYELREFIETGGVCQHSCPVIHTKCFTAI